MSDWPAGPLTADGGCDGTGASSSTLFHFTSRREHLVSILENEFRPRLSFEVIPPPLRDLQPLETALPMVCFCDVPLSWAHYHLDVYGHYGIGLTKAWGLLHGISPVLYCYPASPSAVPVFRVGIITRRVVSASSDTSLEGFGKAVERELHQVLSFMKPYEGVLDRPGIPSRRVRFYDEREWRFVPVTDEAILSEGGLTKEAYADLEIRERVNRALWDNYRIPFEPPDIRFIIVPSEAEILPMIHEIHRIKAKYSDDDKLLLSSRVISTEQIRRDL